MLRTGCWALVVVLAWSAPALAGDLTKQGFKKLKKQIKVAIVNQDEEALASAIVDIGRDDSKQAVDLILKAAVAVPGGQVFSATTKAFTNLMSVSAQKAVSDKVRKKGGHAGVKILCIDGMAEWDDADSGEALAAALTDKRPEVVRAALSAIRKRKEPKAVEGLIDLLERLRKRPDTLLLGEVNTALAEITGKYFKSIEDWRKYWSTVKASFRPQTGGTLPAGLSAGSMSSSSEVSIAGSQRTPAAMNT